MDANKVDYDEYKGDFRRFRQALNELILFENLPGVESLCNITDEEKADIRREIQRAIDWLDDIAW